MNLSNTFTIIRDERQSCMTPTELPVAHRVLLVDDDEAVRAMMNATLERKGFNVVNAASVTEALRCIATESFDVLITDLHMPNPGDGFTVVTAMRHSQPDALTLLVSGYPDVQSAMAAILLEADEIIVKPFEAGRLAELVREKMLTRRPAARLEKERVGVILQRCVTSIVDAWLVRAKQSNELRYLPLSDDERTGHLPKLVEDLALRLSKSSKTSKDSDAVFSATAVAHGKLRYQQGYTPAMLVHESRILQVTIFGTLQSNLNSLDFSLLLPDVMTIADEVDAQLTQSMDSYMKVMQKAAAA
jgi:DNA-binding response OmpR family regulator